MTSKLPRILKKEDLYIREYLLSKGIAIEKIYCQSDRANKYRVYAMPIQVTVTIFTDEPLLSHTGLAKLLTALEDKCPEIETMGNNGIKLASQYRAAITFIRDVVCKK